MPCRMSLAQCFQPKTEPRPLNRKRWTIDDGREAHRRANCLALLCVNCRDSSQSRSSPALSGIANIVKNAST